MPQQNINSEIGKQKIKDKHNLDKGNNAWSIRQFNAWMQ